MISGSRPDLLVFTMCTRAILNLSERCVCVCVCSVSQSCLILCCPMECSLPGSSVHGISQARIPEWVALSYSRGSSRPKDRTHISCVSFISRRILYHSATWETPKVGAHGLAVGRHVRSSQIRDQICVSCTDRQILNH